MDKKTNLSTNQQPHPHQEGQMNNVTPQQEGTGQRVSENKSQGLADMRNDDNEQNENQDRQRNEQPL